MHNLFIIYDIEGWAYHNRALALQKYAPPDFNVRIGTAQNVQPADIIFNLDYASARRYAPVPHVVSFNSDSHRNQDRWYRVQQMDYVICNNKDVWESHGRQQKTCCISNGVDTEWFRVTEPIETRRELVFWTGSDNPKKMKGYDVLLDALPLLEKHGFEVNAVPVSDARTKPLESCQMVAAYNRAAYVLCLSASEGTPNTTLEGMACGCVPVSTNVGNIREFGTPCNSVIIPRSVDGLIEGLERARVRRQMLAKGALKTIQDWSWEQRSKVFFDLFRRILQGQTPEPFSYDEP